MNKGSLPRAVQYGIFGLLAAAISGAFFAPMFPGGLVAFAAFGAVMAVAMWGANELELRAWAQPFFGSRAGNTVWRLVVRLGIYLLVPAVLVYLLGLTGLVALPRGFWSALALCWFPLIVASFMNIFPAKPHS